MAVNNEKETLARLDERTRMSQQDISDIKRNQELQANETAELRNAIRGELAEVKKDLINKIEELDDHFVKVDQFTPVRTFVYGLIGVILLAVAAAVISLVIGGPVPPTLP